MQIYSLAQYNKEKVEIISADSLQMFNNVLAEQTLLDQGCPDPVLEDHKLFRVRIPVAWGLISKPSSEPWLVSAHLTAASGVSKQSTSGRLVWS